jgi:hypothetical protein
MSLDLGTPIFEVAVGLAFIFFLFSLIISSAVEGIAQVFQVREKKLEKGIGLMMGDDDLAGAVIAHPLFKADVTSKKRKPAYVSARNFAMALMRILRREGKAAGAKLPADQVKKGIEGHDKRAKEQLEALLEEGEPRLGQNPLSAFRAEIERWYDDGMDRVSGWYRSWAQLWTCILALVIAVGLNVDTIRIAERLGDSTTLRAAAVKGAEASVAEGASKGAPEATAEDAVENAQDALNKVKELNLPILWGSDNDNVTWNTAVGWLITFLALSLGAPFWFSALSKIAHLKTTGKEPKPAK